MAIVVVGGSGRGVGKTSLICALIAALPEIRWTAVKITHHDHGNPDAIWEERAPGQRSDTGRYLAAGAERALLVSASLPDIPILINELWAKLGPGVSVIIESNRILEYLKPDLCLMVLDCAAGADSKPSFSLAAPHADAIVVLPGAGPMQGEAWGSKPIFHLAELGCPSPALLAWVRLALLHS